ncbi:MAG: carboxypeptidase regulatory-like domain-containing protein [Gemmatimonadetes bacterium]|nr:carboxypeptidase regulatory-like domain-containing protein [Gemmatimonadota bacterium]NIR79492.1 carboxypeptidase regulatory-like domain-containing protein [Gemmatimonadota bacterium]NIT86850.1 carboxypeptidase regulatory-like domain-containing protein [Gemmatimonadota bacterium]NIU30718.1 carboxypeptidase regulatory-like domain-containing protein [Gemmatimonadota bacterium]NIV61078.1 hypothetical protein [Gemmatimonadota bacterium]
MRPARASVLVLALAVLAAPVGLMAQLTGEVTDTAGAPLEGALVEAWSSAEGRLSSQITDGEGRFSFEEPVAERATLLRAGRLGYRPAVRPVEGGSVHHVLRLTEEPISLEGFVVEPDDGWCEMEAAPDARALWHAVARRYAGPMDTVGIATYLASTERLLPLEEIGPLEVPDDTTAQRGSSSQLRFSWTRHVKRDGYAFPVRRTDQGRSYDSWSYAPLEADFAPHFVDPVFARVNRLRIVHDGEDGWTLAFCSQDRDRPAIRGTLQIGADTTLISAEWLFDTPEPAEHAGGKAFFPPVTSPPERAWPLPTESIFWRQLPTGTFQEVHQRFEGWIVAQGDTVPFLPPRGR